MYDGIRANGPSKRNYTRYKFTSQLCKNVDEITLRSICVAGKSRNKIHLQELFFHTGSIKKSFTSSFIFSSSVLTLSQSLTSQLANGDKHVFFLKLKLLNTLPKITNWVEGLVV